jgi:hypothetical protein
VRIAPRKRNSQKPTTHWMGTGWQAGPAVQVRWLDLACLADGPPEDSEPSFPHLGAASISNKMAGWLACCLHSLYPSQVGSAVRSLLSHTRSFARVYTARSDEREGTDLAIGSHSPLPQICQHFGGDERRAVYPFSHFPKRKPTCCYCRGICSYTECFLNPFTLKSQQTRMI